MCFSAEADVVAGLVVSAIGVDSFRQVRRPAERPLGAVPVAIGAHLLVEAVVWQSLTGGARGAVTSVAIAAHLRRAHREPAVRVHPV
jgi:hypothetical protein